MPVILPPRGLIIDLITPLKDDGNIDGRSLGRLLDRVLPHVHGVFLASPYMGEGKGLSAQQREELLEKALVVVQGRVPVLVWITGKTENETGNTLTLLEKRLKTRKYAGPVLWVDTPLYYHSNRRLTTHYQKLSSSCNFPFILHNDPKLIKERARPLKRNNIRTYILKELTGAMSLKGLIYLGPLDRVGHYQKASRSRTNFRIYDGDESRFLDYPSMGGVVSAGANLSTKAWHKITTASLHMGESEKRYPDQLQQLWETGKDLRRMMDLYREHPVPLIKQVLAESGLIDSPACTFETAFNEKNIGPIKELMLKYEE